MDKGCIHAVEHLYEYIDTEIGWYRRTRIRWHLRRCKLCDGAFDFEVHFKEVIRERTMEEPSPELIGRLQAFLEQHRSDGSGT
jgi:anti-sigma factor (TIGR02949 family)